MTLATMRACSIVFGTDSKRTNCPDKNGSGNSATSPITKMSVAKLRHYAKLDALHLRLPKGLALAGDYFSQVGVEAAILSGENTANFLNKNR